MIGKIQMQISTASVAQAIEEYINRHLLPEHKVKVSDWYAYKGPGQEIDTTVLFEEVAPQWPPEHATRVEPRSAPPYVQLDAPDEGAPKVSDSTIDYAKP